MVSITMVGRGGIPEENAVSMTMALTGAYQGQYGFHDNSGHRCAPMMVWFP